VNCASSPRQTFVASHVRSHVLILGETSRVELPEPGRRDVGHRHVRPHRTPVVLRVDRIKLRIDPLVARHPYGRLLRRESLRHRQAAARDALRRDRLARYVRARNRLSRDGRAVQGGGVNPLPSLPAQLHAARHRTRPPARPPLKLHGPPEGPSGSASACVVFKRRLRPNARPRRRDRRALLGLLPKWRRGRGEGRHANRDITPWRRPVTDRRLPGGPPG
jgi:hypothetical protein